MLKIHNKKMICAKSMLKNKNQKSGYNQYAKSLISRSQIRRLMIEWVKCEKFSISEFSPYSSSSNPESYMLRFSIKFMFK
jgi:hypothetical protein